CASGYAIEGIRAGVAGGMFMARVQSGQPTAGDGYELQAIAAVVLGGTSLMGGRGRVLSTLVGALIIGVLTNGMVLMNTPFFTQLIVQGDRKSTRLNSSHVSISYAVFCLKK